jgi:hypothetical protein
MGKTASEYLFEAIQNGGDLGSSSVASIPGERPAFGPPCPHLIEDK